MRRVVVGFLLPLLASAFAGCLDDGSSLAAERPAWRSGYAFGYETTGTAVTDMKGEGKDGRVNQHVEAPLPVQRAYYTVVNTTYLDQAKEPVYLAVATDASRPTPSTPPPPPGGGSGTSRSTEIPAPVLSRNSLVGYRQRDLADAPVHYASTTSCHASDCSVTLDNFAFDPATAPFLEFPLHKGKTWKGTTRADDSGLNWTVEATVRGASSQALPVGTVRTIPVDFAFTPSNLAAYEDHLRSDEHLTSASVDPYLHARVYYAPDYGTVVRTETTMRMDASFVLAEDGRMMRSEVHASQQAVQVLTGARLVAQPERDAGFVARALAGQAPLPDPTGTAQKPAGYTLAISPRDTVLNAAEKPTVRFEGRVVGDEAAFEGHNASWQLVDADGAPVANGQGLAFEHTFDAPGLYTLELEARDAQGRVTASASTSVVANYRAKQSVGCDPVAFGPIFDGCPRLPVQVGAGVHRVLVAADTAGPLDVLTSARLVLTDPKGKTHEDDGSSGSHYEVEVAKDADLAGKGGTWIVQLVESRALLEGAVTYTVDLEYAPRPAGITAGGPPALGVGAQLPHLGVGPFVDASV